MAGKPRAVVVNGRAVEREDEVLTPHALEFVAEARDVFVEPVFRDDFAEFLTLPAYHQLH